jgi:anti-anti-sigma regulatory factor
VTAGLYHDLGVLAAASGSGVVLDCSRVRFMDARTLELILRLKAALQSRKAQLSVCCLDPTLKRVWDITRLTDMIGVADTVDGALGDLCKVPTTEAGAPPPVCPSCPWPQEAACRLCGTGFCRNCGSTWLRACKRHKGKGVAWAFLDLCRRFVAWS